MVQHKRYVRVQVTYRPLVNGKKMSAKKSNSSSPNSGDQLFVESEDQNAAHKPVTLYATLPLDDAAKPTGQT